MVSRYVANGPVKQEGICLMPPPPTHFRMLPPQNYASYMPRPPTPQSRTDPFHVATQQQYGPPPTQTGNQGPAIRAAMAPTGPPTQASTPPNSELKPVAQSMNLAFVQQQSVRGASQNFYAPRGPPQQTQTQRMPNHRQVPQQQVFPTQSAAPYMQVQQPVPQMYCMPYYTGTQRQLVPQLFSGQYTFTTYPPTQPATQYINYGPYLPRAQTAPIVSTPQNLPQQPPQQAIAPNLGQNTQQHNSQKRRRANAIPIIDPTTGVDKLSEVFDEVESHPPSGESSARQTPQPSYIPNKDIQTAFNKQVNTLINQDKMEDIDHSPVPVMEQHLEPHPPIPPVFQSLNTAVHSNPGRNDHMQLTKLQVPQKEFVPGSAVPTAKESTPVVSANADVPELTINKPKDRESPAKNRKQREHAAKEKEPKEAVMQSTLDKRPKEESKTVKDEPKPKEPVAAAASPPPFPKDAKDAAPVRDDKKNVARKDKPEAPVQEIVSDHGAAPACAPILDNSKTKQKNAPKQQQPPLPIHQQGFKPSVPVPVPQTQPAKPNNKTNKMKELNMKGANKEGTDMDAFSDNHAPVEAPPTNTTTTAANVNNVPIENSVSVVIAEVDSNKTAEPDAPTIKHENNAPSPKSKLDVTDIVKDVPKPFVPPFEAADEADKIDLSNEKLVQAKNEANNKNNSSDVDSNAGDMRQALPYKDDQWSPFNQAGKKIYDRDFLLALRNDPKSKRKPDNLLEVVVQEDRGRIGDISRYPLGGRTTDFAPQFSGPNYSGKSSSQRGVPPKRNSQQGKISSNSKNSKSNVLRLSIRENVKLHEAENAWRPARFSNTATLTEDEKKTENLYKKVRGILNKLTPQKFDALLQQIRSLPIDTTERLQGVIDLVFEKAVDEPNFSVAYANMCSNLALIQVSTTSKKEGEFVNFRKLLITRCQLEFEKNSIDETSRNEKLKEIEECTDPEKKKELQLILEDEDRRLRRKSVGNIRFIGELFKKGMLTNNIMMRCLDNLLTNKDEESLECLCKLLSTIGEELEKRKVSLDHIFLTVKEIADRKHGKISSRVRFMLQDVIDLRSAKWVPRRQDSNPKTIDQIQKEANDEQLNIQAMNSGPHTPRKDDRNTSTADRKQRRNNVSDSDGWTTSQSRGGRSGFSVQSDKLKNKPPQIDEPLGSSQMFGQWGRGSNLKTNTQSSLANMYAPLENMGNEIEKRNSMAGGYRSKDPYTSKGPSLERSYKHSSYEDGRGSRSGSQHRSHDGSQRSTSMSNSQPSAPKQMPPPSSAAAPVKMPQELTPERLELKVKDILEEYLNDCCTVAACEEDIRENIPESAFAQLVSYGYNNVLERSTTARLKLSGLFAQLIKMNRLSLDCYCIGLEDVLGQADDLTIDIPMIWDYLGEIVAPLLYENTLPLKRLHKSCSILISQGHAAKLLAPTFKLVTGEKGPNYLTSLWKASELRLSDFMPAERVNDFINENQFEFLMGGANMSMCQSVLTYEQIHNKLLEFFEEENSFDDIINWTTVNVGERVKEKQFIRVLATAIFENSVAKKKLNCDILRKHYKLLNYFIDGTLEYELQILYALQAYVNKLEVPQGLYLLAFTTLYDDTVLSHDTFLNWETSMDPAEQDGKGVALKQLTSFFTNLKEADDDESSSEDA